MATAKRKKATTQRKKAPTKKRAKRGSKRGNIITLDFTDVESGGGMPTPDGYYTAEIKSITEEVGGDSGEPYLAVRWKTSVGSTVFDNFSLQPQSLWVLRTMLECAGYEIPDSEYDLDIDALEGIECGLEIINEEYDEKERTDDARFFGPYGKNEVGVGFGKVEQLLLTPARSDAPVRALDEGRHGLDELVAVIAAMTPGIEKGGQSTITIFLIFFKGTPFEPILLGIMASVFIHFLNTYTNKNYNFRHA